MSNVSENLGRLNTEIIDPRFANIDGLSTLDLLDLFNKNDQSVAESVARVLPTIADVIQAISKRLSQGGRLIYIGAGTSGRLGVLDASECIPTFSIEDGLVIGLIAGGDAALRKGIEGAEDSRDGAIAELKDLGLSQADVLVGIAASGRTPYAIGALEYAQKIGALNWSDPLVAATMNKADAKDWDGLRKFVYSGGRQVIASLAPEVAKAKSEGSEAAASILREAGSHLAKLALELQERLGTTKFVAMGGVFKVDRLIFDSLSEKLNNDIQLVDADISREWIVKNINS